MTVLCYTAAGDGPRSHSISVVTEQDTPGPVSELTVAEVMFNGAVILWNMPLDPNGIITKYTVGILLIFSDNNTTEKRYDDFLTGTCKFVKHIFPTNSFMQYSVTLYLIHRLSKHTNFHYLTEQIFSRFVTGQLLIPS